MLRGITSYYGFAATEGLRCFDCEVISHKRVNHPRRAMQPGSSGGDSPWLQQQQRRDSQHGKHSGAVEPGADDSWTTDTLGQLK